jgi:hypothetical protein
VSFSLFRRAGIAVKASNQLPLYFCLAGGLVGCVTSFIAIWILATLLWFPYWRQLRDYGMRTDDIGEAIAVIVVPPIMGLAFLVSTLISLIAVRWTGHPKQVFITLNLVPGLLVTSVGTNAILHGRDWSEPGFEIACLLIGLGWGAALNALMVRRRGYTEG